MLTKYFNPIRHELLVLVVRVGGGGGGGRRGGTKLKIIKI